MNFIFPLLAAATAFSLSPIELRVAPDPDPEEDLPPVYDLQWQPGPARSNALLTGFNVWTNDVFFAQVPATTTNLVIWPVGQWITNSVQAYGMPMVGGLKQFMGSERVSLVWSNIFWQKPVTNIVTISALMTPDRPTDLNVGNQVTDWPPLVLTNPATPGVNLFWIPQKGTNAQLIECRTGAITNNLLRDGHTFTNWPPFVGRGFYWVKLTSTNI